MKDTLITRDVSKEADKPQFWIEDYYNAWCGASLEVQDVMCNNLPYSELNPIQTFQEYIADKEYYGRKCPTEIIPQRFLIQTDRLVKLYNSVLASGDTSKLLRIISLAERAITVNSSSLKISNS